MRLLKSKNDGELTLTSDLTRDIPPYAILSHTWGSDGQEVTFQDVIQKTGENKAGYEKILFCGRQAKRDALQHFWVDTCCIDKTSSSELTEAINSMFRWYRNAARCYVYLTDVSTRSAEPQSSWQHQFEQSRWFSRGWTLQELLAPVSVMFFSVEGDYLGDRESLQNTIHRITKIPVAALRGAGLGQFSNHERLAWAMSRQTTREEDAAYCLLGIFDVFLPLIYGEGRTHAIARLLERVNQQTGASAISIQPSHPPQQVSVSNVASTPLFDPRWRRGSTCWTFGIEIEMQTKPHKIRLSADAILYYEKVAAAIRKRGLQAKADDLQNPHRKYPEHYDKWWITKHTSLESSKQLIAMEAVSPILSVSGPWENEINTFWGAMRAPHPHSAGPGKKFKLSTLKSMAYGIAIYEPLITRLLATNEVHNPSCRPNTRVSMQLLQCNGNWQSIALLINTAADSTALVDIMQDSRYVLWNFENVGPGKSGAIEFRGGRCLRGEIRTKWWITFVVCLLHAIVAMNDIARPRYCSLQSCTPEALYALVKNEAANLSMGHCLPDSYGTFRESQSS
ncbi:hypothetical protein G7054_g7536 [Neopestalotiopsis clavispora]|nr:hypothetical protein G7054_g7536 [Neopestalotiopsis clavispora]